jgi:hypothetical protein
MGESGGDDILFKHLKVKVDDSVTNKYKFDLKFKDVFAG